MVGYVTRGCYNAGVPDPTFAVVDVETSGLSMRRHRILQIGVVTVASDGTVVDQWCSLVKLRWRFATLGPTRIHGLRRRQLRHAPTIGDAMSTVSRLVAGRILVGHNLAFDAEFLERAARRSRAPLEVSGKLCTLWLSRWLDPERTDTHRLSDLCARYGVALDRPHDALVDAIATAKVLPHLLDAHGVDLTGSSNPAASLAPLFMPAPHGHHRSRSRHLRRLVPQRYLARILSRTPSATARQPTGSITVASGPSRTISRASQRSSETASHTMRTR